MFLFCAWKSDVKCELMVTIYGMYMESVKHNIVSYDGCCHRWSIMSLILLTNHLWLFIHIRSSASNLFGYSFRRDVMRARNFCYFSIKNIKSFNFNRFIIGRKIGPVVVLLSVHQTLLFKNSEGETNLKKFHFEYTAV